MKNVQDRQTNILQHLAEKILIPTKIGQDIPIRKKHEK